MKKIIQGLVFMVAALVSNPLFAEQQIPTAKISADQDKASHIPTTANVTVITASQIKQMGADSLTQILQHYAGLQVRDLYGDGSRVQLSMGGFGSNSLSNVKVLVNGIPLNNPDMGALSLNQVAVQNIERIEILNGSSSVLYGDGAVGGVINIITKQPKKLSGHVGLEAGSNQTRAASTSLGGQWHDMQYYFDGLHKYSNGFRDYNRSDSSNYGGQVVFLQSKGSITLHIQHIEDKVRYPGPLTEQQFDNDPTQAGSNTGDFNRLEQVIDLFFRHHYSQHWMMTNGLSTRHMRGYGEFGSGYTEQRYVHNMNPELTGAYATKNGEFISTTGLYFENDLFELSTVNSHDKRNVSAYYTQASIPIMKDWKFVVGGRFAQARSHLDAPLNNEAVNNHAFITSEALSWQVNHALRWYLRRAGNYRFPKLDESDTINVGAKPLVAQKGVMYQTGMDLRQSKFDTRLDVYQLNLNNEIAYNPTIITGTNFGSNANLDPTRRRDLLFSETYQMLQAWQLGGQYAYVDGQFSQGEYSGNRIPLVARNKFTTFSVVNFASHWTWYAAGIFVGNRYAGGDYANSQGLLSSTSVFNTNISYDFQGWTMALRLNNVTNKQYVESAFVNGADTIGLYPAPGRNMMLSVNYEF